MTGGLSLVVNEGDLRSTICVSTVYTILILARLSIWVGGGTYGRPLLLDPRG